MQGMGVRCPWCAAVAAATTGFANERHLPKGAIFTMDLWSEIFAIGLPLRNTVRDGKTVNLDFLSPNVHDMSAVLAINVAMDSTSSINFYTRCMDVHFLIPLNVHLLI